MGRPGGEVNGEGTNIATLILSIANGLGLLIAGVYTSMRSVATTNTKTLQQRVHDNEDDINELWELLTSERDLNSVLYTWAHQSRMAAAEQGVVLAPIPPRPATPPRIRTEP